nr:T9SS type A sorting domain-containing protein [Bacteroidota bacterium]
MRFLFLSVLFVLTMNCCKAQGINNMWMHGYSHLIPNGGTNINLLNGDTSISYNYRNLPFNATHANIADTNGNLLFYTNGIHIYNWLDTAMENGTYINPGFNVTQWLNYGLWIQEGALILPKPNDSLQYYVFHEAYINYIVPGALYSSPLYYSLVDMGYNNGLGKVIQKSIPIINDTLMCGEIVSTKHANGRDYWILVHSLLGNKFYKMLLTPQGISVDTQSIGSNRNLYGGYAKFSLDGSKLAVNSPSTKIDLFDFDRCTGMLSNHININNPDSGWAGVGFSSDGSKLYYTAGLTVYQYDLTAPNIAASVDTVATWDGFFSYPGFPTTFLYPYNGYDGRIYWNCGSSTLHLHRIEFPDKLGDSCMFVQHNILCPTFNAFTQPNHPNYHLGPLVGSPCDTLNLTPGPSPKERGVVRVIPNPIKGNILNIEYPVIKNKNNSLKIFDAQGNNVYIRTLPMWSGMHDFPVPNLSPGLYMIQIIDGENRSYGKFCIF